MTRSVHAGLPGADLRHQRCGGPLAARAPVQPAMLPMSPSPTSLAAPITLYVISMFYMYAISMPSVCSSARARSACVKHMHLCTDASAMHASWPSCMSSKACDQRSASERAFTFPPSLRKPIQADKCVDVHTRTQKTAFHESLYDKGKEAQRRKQAWADKQKQVTGEAHGQLAAHLRCTYRIFPC